MVKNNKLIVLVLCLSLLKARPRASEGTCECSEVKSSGSSKIPHGLLSRISSWLSGGSLKQVSEKRIRETTTQRLKLDRSTSVSRLVEEKGSPRHDCERIQTTGDIRRPSRRRFVQMETIKNMKWKRRKSIKSTHATSTLPASQNFHEYSQEPPSEVDWMSMEKGQTLSVEEIWREVEHEILTTNVNRRQSYTEGLPTNFNRSFVGNPDEKSSFRNTSAVKELQYPTRSDPSNYSSWSNYFTKHQLMNLPKQKQFRTMAPYELFGKVFPSECSSWPYFCPEYLGSDHEMECELQKLLPFKLHTVPLEAQGQEHRGYGSWVQRTAFQNHLPCHLLSKDKVDSFDVENEPTRHSKYYLVEIRERKVRPDDQKLLNLSFF